MATARHGCHDHRPAALCVGTPRPTLAWIALLVTEESLCSRSEACPAAPPWFSLAAAGLPPRWRLEGGHGAAQSATPVANAAAAPLPDADHRDHRGAQVPASPAGASTSPIWRTGAAAVDYQGRELVVPHGLGHQAVPRRGRARRLRPGLSVPDARLPPRHGRRPRGRCKDDLILVADGDLTMGGRNTPERPHRLRVQFDHTYANLVPEGATLTPENPLASIDDLARQVAAAGIPAGIRAAT